jgi:DNA-binding response OmpR family regulator
MKILVADDYLFKRLSVAELAASVGAQLRRSHEYQSPKEQVIQPLTETFPSTKGHAAHLRTASRSSLVPAPALHGKSREGFHQR